MKGNVQSIIFSVRIITYYDNYLNDTMTLIETKVLILFQVRITLNITNEPVHFY